MTAAALIGNTLLGFPHNMASSDGSTTLDATTDYVCFVVKAPATGTIDKVYVRLGSTTLVGTLSCRIYNIDAAGDPDTASVYGSCAQSDYTATGIDDNTFITFDSLACSATIGDNIAIMVWASVVTAGSGGIATNSHFMTGATPIGAFPYITTRTTGTGAGTHAGLGAGVTLEYSGAVYYDIGCNPACTAYTENLDSDGSIRRAGNRFILPVPVTAVGIWALIDNDTDTTTLKLYDTDGTTVLGTVTLVAAARVGISGGYYWGLFGGAAVALSANTASAYRVVAETNNTSATAVGCRGFTTTAAHLAQMPMGTAWHHTSHNGTSWTDTTTKRMHIGLLASKFDDGAGGGGSVALPPIRQH